MKNILLNLLAFLLVIGSIFGGILLYSTVNKNKSLMEEFSKQQSLENTVSQTNLLTISKVPALQSASNASVETGWKTYANSSFKFSINFPDTLQSKESTYPLGVTSVEFRNASNTNSSDAPDFQLLIFPKSIGKMIKQDFDSYYAEAPNISQIIKSKSMSQNFTKLHNRTVGNLSAFDYKTTAYPANPNLEPEIGTYIEIGSNVIIVSTGESSKATLETILGSFKYPI